MKNTSKVKFKITLAKVCILYADGTTKIDEEELVGKFTLNNARKYIKENYPADFGEIKEVKNVEVLDVVHTTVTYTVDTDELYVFAQSNRIEEGSDDASEDAEESDDE